MINEARQFTRGNTPWVEKKIPEVNELDGQRQAVDGVRARVDERLRGGLAFKAHRLVCILNARLESHKEEKKRTEVEPASELLHISVK